MNALEAVQAALGLEEDDSMTVVTLCDLVDRERLEATAGYPKDNAFPDRSLAQRLADPLYLEDLLAAARDDEDVEPRIVDALVARWEAVR